MSKTYARTETLTADDRRTTRRQFIALAGGAAVAALALPLGVQAAWADDATQTVTDMDNDQVAVPAQVTRYADAWAEHVAWDCLLDGGAGLVATATSEQGCPWLYTVVPALSQATTTFQKGFSAADVEALDPQVVFADDDDLRDELTAPVVDVDADTFAAFKQALRLTAQVLGSDAGAKAEDFIADFEKTLDEVAQATKGIEDGERPTVLAGDAVYRGRIEGADSLANEWILAAGGRNANPDDDDDDDATVDDVQTLNPDIIVTGSLDDAQQILNDRSWDGIAAVRESRVYACPRGLNGWGEAGPELMLQVLWLAGTMYPDVFPADEVAVRIQDFYRTYYGFEASFEDVELMLAAQGPDAAQAEPATTEEKPAQ